MTKNGLTLPTTLLQFKEKFPGFNEATVKKFKSKYASRKRKLEIVDDIEEIPVCKRGRKVLIGEKVDSTVQEYLTVMREIGGIVNCTIALAVGNAALLSQDKTRHIDHGGDIHLARHWPSLIMSRMGLVKLRGCTTAKPEIRNFPELKEGFLTKIKSVFDHNILPLLVINYDHTGKCQWSFI